MKPILYEAAETEFDTNGLGILGEAVRCTVEQERTGIFELEMEYPTEGRRYGELCLRRIILALPDNLSDPQPFRIYKISKPMKGTVTVYARHIAYDLMGVPVKPFSATSAAAALNGLKTNAVTDCPFEFWTDKTTAATMTVEVPSSIWSLLGGSAGGILDVYGGEYEFDKWTVKLHKERGKDRGVTIRYGKNLTSLQQEENCANVYTGIYPYWVDANGTLVELEGKILNASGSYDFTRILTKDFSQEWQEPPSQETLRARAEKYMKDNNIGVPRVSLEVSFVALEQTEEYKTLQLLEQVSLCDKVTVEFPRLGVSATAECVGVRFDTLKERYEKLEIGEAKSTFAKAVAFQEKQLEEISRPSYLQQSVERATKLITGSRGGRVVTVLDGEGKPQEICILTDSQDIETATSLWRWNEGGLGHSKNGYEGDYQLALTKDGQIVATAITTGTMNASLIRAGLLTDTKGKNYWNLETGDFSLSAASTVGGSTVQSIADSSASAAASAAEASANSYTDGAVSSYNSSLNQQVIFNKLTNNGQTQGIYLQNGLLYINGTYIKAGDIDAGNVSLSGAFRVFKTQGGASGGYIGFMNGNDGIAPTDGIGVCDATGQCYFIATNGGVRMQAFGTRVFIDNEGKTCIDGDLKVSGSVTEYANF